MENYLVSDKLSPLVVMFFDRSNIYISCFCRVTISAKLFSIFTIGFRKEEVKGFLYKYI